MVGMSGAPGRPAGFSPETSVTPSVALEWDSPQRPRSSTWSTEAASPPPPGSTSRRTPGSRVAAHYDSVAAGATLAARQSSPLIALRAVNNFMKANLLGDFCRKPGFRVLDMACGKGGDLFKWAKLGVREWVGVDIARGAVNEAVSRYNGMKERRFVARFVAADATRVPIWKHIGPVATGGAGFDLASCQFALHYGCGSEAHARMMLWNIAAFLKPGAHFVATTVDEAALRSRLAKSPDKMTLSNEHFSLRMHAPLPASDKDLDFGLGYDFALGDLVDCPEFVVPTAKLQAVAAEFDLQLVFSANFSKMYDKYKMKAKYNRMLPAHASQAEWDIISLYKIMVFAKRTGNHILDQPVKAMYPPLNIDTAVTVLGDD